MTKAKRAATLMLCRENKGALEVLLLKRNKALAFAAGLWVFPGGKVEDAELIQTKEELEAAKLAAVRETKEETNISIDAKGLIFFRHWTTPKAEKRRFATYFFFGTIDSVDSKVTIDDSEIKAHQWLSPQVALDKLVAQKLPMMPPTIMSLQLISKCKSVAQARNLLSKIQPSFVLPIIHLAAGKVLCIYEGDAAYTSGNVNMTGARHRLIMDVANGGIEFEFSGCSEDIIPVNGGVEL